MDRSTSIYLDGLRFLAAMVVFLGHVSGARFTGGLFWQFGPYMSDAVILFFVLSGYVIGYVTDSRETSAADYAVARLARIYSVAAPAIIATLVLDRIGRSLRPDLYAAWWGFSGEHLLAKTVGSLLFVNRLWFSEASLGSMLPYWSLCYEVWYYLVFGVAMFAPRSLRIPGALLLLTIAGPRIAALLPVWLAGLAAYRVSHSQTVGRRFGAGLWLGSVAIYAAWSWWGRTHAFPEVLSRLVSRASLPNDYMVGLLAALNLIGFAGLRLHLGPTEDRIGGFIRWWAGATFTIYLFHVPVAQFLIAVTPWGTGSWANRVWILGGALVAMLFIAEFTERRKEIWRRLFRRLASALAPSPAVRAGRFRRAFSPPR